MKKLLLTLLVLVPLSLKAQTQKFGKVPKADLEMTVYDKDSTASAVVLFTKGESELSYLNDQFVMIEYHHVRVKILTDEGLKEGGIEISFRNRKSNTPQKVSNIKAQSYTLGDDGKVIKKEVGRKDRFEEEISEYRSEIKFTIPGLKKGSIFEYSYKITSNGGVIFPPLVFQEDIPIIWTEFKAKIPEWFRFLTVSKGYHGYAINEQKRYNDRVNFNTRRGVSTLDYVGTEYHFAMKDVPAIGDEPYMKASIDYISHMRFQLSSINMPQTLVENTLDTWGELVNRLNDDEDYGKRLRSSDELDELVVAAIADADTDTDKMIAIYNMVKNVMEWDKKHGLYSYESLKDMYSEGTGNGTSINLLMIQLLREVGLEAHPVAISTRFNGEIIDLFPIAGQFNHTIAYVEIGDQYFLLDAKNEHRPYNILPPEDMSGQGLMIYKDEVFWVPLENQVVNSQVNVINIDLSDTGYSGSITSKNKGLFAVQSRTDFNFLELEKSIEEEVFNSIEDFKVDSASVLKDKLDESFDYSAYFSTTLGEDLDIIYFNPMINIGDLENPFKLAERTFPVDYDYPYSESIIMNITIPEGWVIDESPTTVSLRLPEQGGDFRRIAQVNGNVISINYRFRINKTRFMPAEYAGLKQFYQQMITSLEENIVLKKES